jgi:hypothetical protein
MYGYYLTSDDDKFLDLITDELNKYNLSNDLSLCVSFCFLLFILFYCIIEIYYFFILFFVCSILLFPPLSSRHRLLLHQLRDKNYSNLFSFSVGEEKNRRRTIICFKSQLMDETNMYECLDILVCIN